MSTFKGFLLLLFVFFLENLEQKIYLCWRKNKKAKTSFTIPAAFYECLFLIKEETFCSAMR